MGYVLMFSSWKKMWKVFSLFQSGMKVNVDTSGFFSDIFSCPAISSLNTAFSLCIILPYILFSLFLLWDIISCLSYMCYPDEQCHGMRDPPNGLKFWRYIVGYNSGGCVHPKPKNVCLDNKMIWACLCFGLHILHISH